MHTESSQIYVIRLRSGKTGMPGWREKLLAVPGITVISVAGRQGEIRCLPQAIARVAADLGPDFLIEKVLQRRPL